MAFETGTALSAVDLVNKLNTFLTANGWTKLRGDTDIAPASPKAARYWRVLSNQPDAVNDDYHRLRAIEFRTAVGGANVATDPNAYTFSSIASGSAADLLADNHVSTGSADINDNIWWISYDFGSPTIVREVLMRAITDNYAPAHFHIQWSQDNVSWTTMFHQNYDESLWTADDQTNIFTFDDGHLAPQHPSATVPRRGGWSRYPVGSSTVNRMNEHCDDIWAWQGPGYDVDRRVYVSAMTGYDISSNDEWIMWDMSTSIDVQVSPAGWFGGQQSSIQADLHPAHLMTSAGVTYWFYVSSKRFIVVTRSGVDDYTSSYLGFLSAFARPDDYPFPMYVGSTTGYWTSAVASSLNAGYRDMHDPGYLSAWARDWNNDWLAVYNHDISAGASGNWAATPDATTWPIVAGHMSRSDWPYAVGSDHEGAVAGHWLSSLDPTEQGDLPLFPVTVTGRYVGNIGVLEGVVKVPSGGVLAPEATFTVGGDTYRVFATRTSSEGYNYYAIKEV